MPLTQYWQVLKPDAVAVVGDLDELEAAVLDGDGDGGRAGVDAVLDELLHRRGRPLDHLPRGDAVHHRLFQPPDAGRFSAASAAARRRVVDVHVPGYGVRRPGREGGECGEEETVEVRRIGSRAVQ